MNIFAVREAIRDAKYKMELMDRTADALAELLRGHLRHVDRGDLLISLKRELRDFNITTGQWKARS